MRTSGGVGTAHSGDVQRHHVRVAHNGLHLLEVHTHRAHTVGFEEQVLHQLDGFRTVHIALVTDIGIVQEEVGLLQHHLVQVGIGTDGLVLSTQVKAGIDGHNVDHLLQFLVGAVIGEGQVVAATENDGDHLVLQHIRYHIGEHLVGVFDGFAQYEIAHIDNAHRRLPAIELVELPADFIGGQGA